MPDPPPQSVSALLFQVQGCPSSACRYVHFPETELLPQAQGCQSSACHCVHFPETALLPQVQACPSSACRYVHFPETLTQCPGTPVARVLRERTPARSESWGRSRQHH